MGVLKIGLEFDWVPKWPRTNMGTEVFCMMLLGWGHMNIYICIYIKDEIHMERVTYIYIERKREMERAIKRYVEKTDSCCNIPHTYVPIPTPRKYGETNA